MHKWCATKDDKHKPDEARDTVACKLCGGNHKQTDCPTLTEREGRHSNDHDVSGARHVLHGSPRLHVRAQVFACGDELRALNKPSCYTMPIPRPEMTLRLVHTICHKP
jgi:hypothetical protein